MSEQSQGPGWWQAADGKWYAPEQAATGVQPMADPTATQPVAGGPLPAGGPPPYAAPAAAAGGGAGKIIAIVVALALIAGGGAAFLLTRDSGGGGSVQAFCDQAKKIFDSKLDESFSDPSKVDQVVAEFDKLAKAAPSEIKADMNTVVDALKKSAAAEKAGKDPDTALTPAEQDGLERASKNAETFGAQKCPGIGFSSSSSSSRSSSSDTDSFSFTSDFDSDSSSLFSDSSSILDSDFFSSFSTSS